MFDVAHSLGILFSWRYASHICLVSVSTVFDASFDALLARKRALSTWPPRSGLSVPSQ